MNLTTYKKTVILGFALLAGISSYAQEKTSNGINIGLVYPLSSNGTNAVRDTNSFSLNAIGGISAAEKGTTIAGFFNVVKHNVNGVQIAGFTNLIGGNAKGAMFAGFINTYANGDGLAVAGFTNISVKSSGIQIAGFFNGGGNTVESQIAGFANVARKVKGVQISGFLNVAEKVNGTQLSFMNVADSAGTQIGLINISRNGEKSFGLTIDENQTTLLTFRSGGKVLYGVIGAGYNFKNKKEVYGYEAGLGAHIINSFVFRLNTEVVAGGLTRFDSGHYFKSTFRLMPALRLGHSAEIFGGPSLNYIETDTAEGKKLNDHYISSWTRNSNQNLHAFYIGYTAGLQFSF